MIRVGSEECSPFSRRARVLVIGACLAAIVVTAFLAQDVRDVAASLALGFLFVLVIQLGRRVMP
jgi:hypothetical protein